MFMVNNKLEKSLLTILILTYLAACSLFGEDIPPTPSEAMSGGEATQSIEAPTATDEVVDEAPPADTPAAPAESLGAERQLLSFTTADGRTLEGYYYPAKTLGAPMVVLMHWARGTMDDWSEIALWLQNRTTESSRTIGNLDAMVKYSNQETEPWKDASWFPVLPAEASFAVLTFNFGGYGNSQAGSGGEGLLQDAMAALSAAASLPQVDRNRITAVGASIGADASVDSCQAFNALETPMGVCVGAFSISPGNYLGQDYGEMVGLLRNQIPPKTVVCLAAAGDGNALPTCLSASGTHFTATAYEGSDHGMQLVRPDLSPNALTLLVGFLETVYGINLQPPQ